MTQSICTVHVNLNDDDDTYTSQVGKALNQKANYEKKCLPHQQWAVKMLFKNSYDFKMYPPPGVGLLAASFFQGLQSKQN